MTRSSMLRAARHPVVAQLISAMVLGLAFLVSTDSRDLSAPASGETRPARFSTALAESDIGAVLPPGVDPSWWSEVNHRLAMAEYEISPGETGPQAPNRAQNLRSTFHDAGIEIRHRDSRVADWSWSWQLAGWGREGHLQPAERTAPACAARRVEYLREGITEWYENTAAGLEQGFTISERPEGAGDLCILGALAGDLEPRPQGDEAIIFADADGSLALRYSKLLAWDSTGRELPGELALADGGILLRIDDSGAVYPVTVDPLMDTPDWSVDGYQGNTPFGYCVATAGDVDGDGYSDVLVCAPRYASGGPARGRVWLYLGGPAGLDTDWDWYGYGEQNYANYGQCAASAGDVNGDGYDDVVVGQPFYDDSFTDEGRVYVYYGGADGLPWTANWTRNGGAASADFGLSVASAGDVNADGFADVIVGADNAQNGQTQEGLAYVFHGGASGLAAGWSWRGESNEDHSGFGHCVATAGDVNGDGYDDVIVGAPSYNLGGVYGHAYVFHGSASGVQNPAAWHLGLAEYGSFGYSVATAGDVSGDGYSDVLVGAHSWSGDIDLEGRACLFEGSASGLPLDPSWTDEGGQNNSAYGWCVATAGDINADGYSDVLVTAKEYNGDYVDQGRVYLYMGNYSGLGADPVWIYDGAQTEAWCGWSAAAAGDVNGDGFGDIILGIPDQIVDGYEIGRVVGFYGGRSGPRTQAGWVTESNQTSAHYGGSLACVGDVNGDGYSDVLVGASGFDNGQVDEGAVFLYLGSHQGLSAVFSWYAEGNQAGAALGVSIAGAGDVNGDGFPEAIVGAPGYTNSVSDEGAAFIWFAGSPYGNPANASWSAFSGQAASDFGFAVAGGGDFDGDGYADVIVGAPYYDAGQTNEGAVFVYLGSESGPSPSHDWFHGADFANAEYGLSVAAAGDFNGDGFSDVFVGAPKYYVGESQEGWAFIYLGSAEGPVGGPPWWSCKSNQAVARLGEAVAYAGDVNGDGFSDILVGAPRWDSAYSNSGQALLWLGQATAPPSGDPTNADWSTIRGQSDAWWGYTVASAGDVNGDGYSDILVGSPYCDSDAGANSGMAALWFGSASGIVGGAAAWIAEGQQAECYFAWRVATAGDVNGDGFADIMVGARSYDAGQTDEGRAFLYYGNDSRGLSRKPQQWRNDLSAPVAPLGLTGDPHEFVVSAHGRSAIGRSRVRLEYEIKPFGTPFDGTNTVLGDWTATGAISGPIGSFAALGELVSGLTQGVAYHWRLRVHTDDPFFPCSPWVTLPDNAAAEADLRTAPAGTAVSDLPATARALQLSIYPNPFNPQTTLSYQLPTRARVHLRLYDVQGRLLRVLVDGMRDAGAHTESWDGRDAQGRALGSGVYFARLDAEGWEASCKLLLVR